MVSLFTLGQGSIVMNGGKLALGETLKMGAKMLAVDAISTGVAYGTSEICQAMGCPGGLTLVLSLLAGMGTSAGLGSKVFGNGGLTPDDIAYQRYWDELASGNHLPPGMTAEEYTKYLGGLGKVDDAIALNRVDYDEIIKLRKGNEGASGANFLSGMSSEDAKRYELWNHLRENGLDQKKINDIILTNKGLRPNPNTYLSETYINNHLKQFNGGVTKIMTQAPSGTAGPPGGTFVMPSSVADDLIAQAGGDISKLEKLLSLEPGTLGTSPVRVDVKNPSNIRIPSGNELGANSQWLPGGNTGGGIPEATITSPKPGEYIVKPIK